MKRIVILLIFLTAIFYGCGQTGKVVVEKNLTKMEAEKLAVEKVYEVTKNKDVYNGTGPIPVNALQKDDRWIVTVLAGHTQITTYVYNNGTVKVLPTAF